MVLTQRVLVIRYDGTPFHVRMSKVISTILNSGLACDVLIPFGGLGHQNVAKEMGRDLTQEVRLFEFPIANNFPVRLTQKLFLVAVFGNREFEACLAKLLEHTKYDLIWVKDTPCLPMVFRCLAKSRNKQAKVVCDMYENMTEQLNDFLIRFGSLGTRLIAYAIGLIPRVRRLEREFLPQCDHVFVVVEEAKDFLLEQYQLDSTRISVVHNVERLAEFDQIERRQLPLHDGKTLISYVGSFGPHRGLELLIEAARSISNRPHPPFHLALVGASPREVLRFQSLCRDQGIEDMVSVIEYQSHRVAMQWIKQSDVGLIPHVDTPQIRTTVPNKLFQYMAAGVGCIVSDVGPLGRIVRDTECGLVFRPKSAEALADALVFALNHPEQMQAMGVRGRTSVEKQYSWEIEGRLYRQYLELQN